MRDEDMLDVLCDVRDYLEDHEDVIGDEGDIPNKAMKLKRDLQEVIVALGGE